MIYRCPVPGCEYEADYITERHYLGEHAMEKASVEYEYGKPVPLRVNPLVANKNLYNSWRTYGG